MNYQVKVNLAAGNFHQIIAQLIQFLQIINDYLN